MSTITSIAPDGTFTSESVSGRLLTPGEVASMFRVDPKTVTRWAREGKLTFTHTPGGQRRYWETEVRTLLRGEPANTGG